LDQEQVEKHQQFKILKIILKIHYFFSFFINLIFSIDFAILTNINFWKDLECLINNCLKIYMIEDVKIDSAANFFSLFTHLQSITDQKIILIFDEFDNIFDIDEKDSFLSALRSLKNDKKKHNITVK
jgi:hypothetical protein